MNLYNSKYFNKHNENQTCIYAVNKKFYKNKYNYISEEISYIDTKKKDN